MLKKLSILFIAATLSACSLSSYVPFMGSKKTVINLDADSIDQKSYATAYEATVETYRDRVHDNYNVNSFASGANDWYLGRILIPIEQIKEKLYSPQGQDSDIYAYYSGVIHAEALQTNFSKLNPQCWSHINTPSLTQGIYDAMLDLQSGKVRSENDEYIVQGSEQLLKLCAGK
jgi:DNA polymerase III, delta' subunit